MFEQLSHVGVLVRDLDAAARRWTSLFGLIEVDRFRVEAEGITSVILSTGGRFGETPCVELMSPIDPDDLTKAIPKRLATAGEGVFHLAFRVGQPERVADLVAAGLTVIDAPDSPVLDGTRYVVHPASANGVLIELLSGSISGSRPPKKRG